MNPIAIRLLSQQLIVPQYANPADVVAHFGAMQAQDYRMMRWAVAMRTKNPSLKAFRKAYDEGRIVRMHLLRCTWQLVAAEDYAWMLELCRSKAMATLNGWMHSNKIYIPDEEHDKIAEILCQTAADNGSVTKEDFEDALASRDIVMDDHRLSYHIRMAEFRGAFVSGNLHTSKATYSLAENKIAKRDSMGRDEALALLARKYFQSHSPATLEDFVWWSGLNAGDCRKGIAFLGKELCTEKYCEREFYIHESCRTRGMRKGQTLLLAPYDEYLIGYKSRDVVLAPEYRHRAHNNSGIFYPIIAHDGVICGNWKPHAKSQQTDFFSESVEVQSAWDKYIKYNTK